MERTQIAAHLLRPCETSCFWAGAY